MFVDASVAASLGGGRALERRRDAGEVRRYVLPTMQKQGPVVAWIVDDTGFRSRESIR